MLFLVSDCTPWNSSRGKKHVRYNIILKKLIHSIKFKDTWRIMPSIFKIFMCVTSFQLVRKHRYFKSNLVIFPILHLSTLITMVDFTQTISSSSSNCISSIWHYPPGSTQFGVWFHKDRHSTRTAAFKQSSLGCRKVKFPEQGVSHSSAWVED